MCYSEGGSVAVVSLTTAGQKKVMKLLEAIIGPAEGGRVRENVQSLRIRVSQNALAVKAR